MKISEKIAQSQLDNRPWWSFEFFPPKTPNGWVNLYERIGRMKELGPIFVDITWGAGGTTSSSTTSFVKHAHENFGLETCMHLTCTNMPVTLIDQALKDAYESGCRNILALRGDPPRGKEEWESVEGGFEHAVELVRHIRKNYGDHFDIGIAGFPEGHPHSTGMDDEMKYLKEKVDAGANIIFTQMFYDTDVFIAWARRVRAMGITIPIVPGIMPIQTYSAFHRRTKFMETVVPENLHNLLEGIKDDDAAVREEGTKYVADMCRRILETKDLGIHGIHIYTMNLSRGTEMLLEELKFVGSADIVKPLPWTVSLTPQRRSESTRPIFWSNRRQSYLSRTAEWDEFPNGRWGHQSSPAFGDVDSMKLALPHSPSAAEAIWGVPTSVADIELIFSRFCTGQISDLPWSDGNVSKETTLIKRHLERLNENGFLTVNSQPRVDGVVSEDPVVGWGPRGGYVYQKAYLEFFVATSRVDELVKLVLQVKGATYHVVTKSGELATNSQRGPNAVTWGVFPNAEVIQPTVVESTAFMAWKDEAFELWNQWALLYEASYPKTAELMRSISDTYSLVNIVYNDYRATDDLAIFRPFAIVSKGSDSIPNTPDSEKSSPTLNGLRLH